jgi:hypothetical protein
MTAGKKLTTNTIAQIALDQKYKDLQQLVLSCRQKATEVKRLVLAYSEPLFISYGFRDAITNELIAESKYSYAAASEEDDHELLFRDYYEKLHSLHIENGFEVKEVGYCPALIAENSLLKAENKLLGYMEERLGMPEIIDIEDRKEAIKLYLSIKVPQKA